MSNATSGQSQVAGSADVLTADRVAAALRDDILRGVLKPGARLKDFELAERFDVSRNTLREAVKQLGTAGLVTTRLNAGSAVRRLSEADAREIYIIRRTLELSGVDSLSRAGEAQMLNISAAIEEARRAAAESDWSELSTASLRFHQAVAALNGSARLDAFFANVLAQLRLVNWVMTDEPSFQMQWVDRDKGIADLLLQGNRHEAHIKLSRYLDDSEALIINAIRRSPDGLASASTSS
ncbi:GntR family transcriptional regulator [Arthrobacter sp. ISL-28]|uniref:GntR family transcriptional regulator n=1 Tax=Arthrobacter sp. ISL-28 TaxID=2819108 RepID=UPI001BECE957|nr:GntR family transcriptional regulator [Arthrobacter sp. ISL-28]MBT2520165.1 GntR family transcriptional regulator [Arthrobacter sp. ISL-28]